MNDPLRIVATVDQPQLLENNVEKLARRKNEHRLRERFETWDWQAVDSSSVESLIKGSLVFNTNNAASSFATGFLFTCLKQNNSGFKLNWSLSLS